MTGTYTWIWGNQPTYTFRVEDLGPGTSFYGARCRKVRMLEDYSPTWGHMGKGQIVDFDAKDWEKNFKPDEQVSIRRYTGCECGAHSVGSPGHSNWCPMVKVG